MALGLELAHGVGFELMYGAWLRTRECCLFQAFMPFSTFLPFCHGLPPPYSFSTLPPQHLQQPTNPRTSEYARGLAQVLATARRSEAEARHTRKHNSAPETRHTRKHNYAHDTATFEPHMCSPLRWVGLLCIGQCSDVSTHCPTLCQRSVCIPLWTTFSLLLCPL